MSEVIIYTKIGCPYCQAAIADFMKKGVAFKEVNVSENPEAKKLVKERYNATKVPVIVREGQLVEIGFNGGG
jgi:glutaredoxin 3